MIKHDGQHKYYLEERIHLTEKGWLHIKFAKQIMESYATNDYQQVPEDNSNE